MSSTVEVSGELTVLQTGRSDALEAVSSWEDDTLHSGDGDNDRQNRLSGGEERSFRRRLTRDSTATFNAEQSKVVMRFRQGCGRIVNNDRVQFGMVILIILNSIMMGLATFDFVSTNPRAESAFENVDTVFLIIFSVEVVMQLIYHGSTFFGDGWLVFDLVIISLSWGLQGFQIIRAFRIFRALRLVTRVRTLKNLITALLDVLPNMMAITALLLLIFYIFAVMFTVLFKNLYKDGVTEVDYFGRLDTTFFTLLQITTLDDWANIARICMEVYTWAWAPFLAFVSIAAFIVYNLIIAVVCDAVATVEGFDRRDEEEEEMEDAGFVGGGEANAAEKSFGFGLASSENGTTNRTFLGVDTSEEEAQQSSTSQRLERVKKPIAALVENQAAIEKAMSRLIRELGMENVPFPAKEDH